MEQKDYNARYRAKQKASGCWVIGAALPPNVANILHKIIRRVPEKTIKEIVCEALIDYWHKIRKDK